MNPCSTTFYNPETGATQSYLDDNGFYLKTLKMYFKANQMGLVDPDSPTQNWDTVWSKNADGQALFSWWSWLGGAFNTDDHMTAGKGFALIPIADEKIYNDGINANGLGQVICIGKKAKDPARLMDFINWMSTPEGFQTQWAGPEGLTWKMVNGEPVLTDFGKNANEKNKPVPAQYGGGNFRDGMWQSATIILINRGKEMNPVTKYPYDYRLWPSSLKDTNQLDKNWQAAFKSTSVVDYLMARKMFIIGLPTAYTMPTESTDVTTQRNEISNVVCNASWKMIFAKDQAEFNTLWQDMKKQAMGLGYAGLNALDKQYVKEWYKTELEVKASLNK
jgi:multiple sugar transport system substrate-binding protein/putative aldouronate transport system substrate-binding protein